MVRTKTDTHPEAAAVQLDLLRRAMNRYHGLGRRTVALVFLFFISPAIAVNLARSGEGQPARQVFARDNLVAWCIVPFDAKQRGPVERAKMLRRLGFNKLAYDWRAQHVPTFEQEILALKEHGIEMFAFWGEHEKMFALLEHHGLTPQVWITAPSPEAVSQKQRVEAAGKRLLPVVQSTRKLGCKLGLYNHGGWGGEPKNLVAVCQWLRDKTVANHVGIVYNLHHGHGHIEDFAHVLADMKSYLWCLNLNGMNDNATPKIVSIGRGQRERMMIQTIRDSGYQGPIGILDHRGQLDAEESLRENLAGLREVLAEMGDTEALKTYR